jgi:hemoglobin
MPAMTSTSSVTPYEQLGGTAAVRQLVDRFYDLMDLLPEVYALRKLHPADLSGSRDKLTWFLTGWLGGPPDYESRFGHPRLRARHLPFAIDTAMRDQWLLCMAQALDEQQPAGALRDHVWQALTGLADHMRNHPDSTA